MFFVSNTWFPHKNNAISYSFCHGVSFFGLGLILGVFWGFFGARFLGSLREPCGTNLGFSWVTLCLLGSLVTQIWASVGWLCVPWGQVWLLLGIWFVNKVFCPIFGGHWLSFGYWWIRFRSRLNYILHGWIFGWGYIWSFASKVFMAALVCTRCMYREQARILCML